MPLAVVRVLLHPRNKQIYHPVNALQTYTFSALQFQELMQV